MPSNRETLREHLLMAVTNFFSTQGLPVEGKIGEAIADLLSDIVEALHDQRLTMGEAWRIGQGLMDVGKLVNKARKARRNG